MTPTNFPQANKTFVHPPDLDETQCRSIPAFCGEVKEGNIDGAIVVVVAWKPSEDDLFNLNNGQPVFLSCIGGLPPHFLTTVFPYQV